MPELFVIRDFSGGLDAQLDAEKIPSGSYPLLVDGRIRENVVVPTQKHLELDAPSGTYQGLYAAGSYLILFVSGVAYYADLNESPIVFNAVSSWATMSATADRIYAELVPSTCNFFNVSDIPQLGTKTFNSTIAGYPQALFVFDGISQPASILPNGNTQVLGVYDDWTPDDPEYVPIGSIPVVLNNKLFLASPDKTQILHSISGRASDFVVNVDVNGDKGGDAYTVATSVSFNPVTALKALSSGVLLATTLYATYAVELDYENAIFGEPYLKPTLLFPVGCINELSIVDVLQDTAFITQSGIHSFNAVAQSKKESNNEPFGAKVHGLLTSPQADTCAVNHDDYAYFAVNTIYGYGAIVYDTIAKAFVSLDLSFGHTKQFANTRLSGSERLFFITHDNKIFEAFADAEVNSPKLYIGDFTPSEASSQVHANMIDLQFSKVETDGEVKVSIYVDKQFKEAKIYSADVTGYTENLPMPLPYAADQESFDISYSFKNTHIGWRVGALIEWNFKGNLTNVSFGGTIESAANAGLIEQVELSAEDFAFISETSPGAELNDGGNFNADGYEVVDVTQGSYYIFDPVSDIALANGNIKLTTSGIFQALSDKVVIQGTAAAAQTFTLRSIDNFRSVLQAINNFQQNGRDIWTPQAIIGGGNHSWPSGTLLQCQLGLLPIKLPIHAVAGNIEYDTTSASSWFNTVRTPRYYAKAFTNVEFFFYNGGWTSANCSVDSSGITTGATSEPDGNNTTSVQANILRNRLATSTATFKIIVVHFPPYTADATYDPGYADLRFLAEVGADAIISGHGRNMQRFYINGFPYFVCGTGGKALVALKETPTNEPAFSNVDSFGFLAIHADALSCTLSFVDVDGNVLDSYALYA